MWLHPCVRGSLQSDAVIEMLTGTPDDAVSAGTESSRWHAALATGRVHRE
jgi:hypothetical protein